MRIITRKSLAVPKSTRGKLENSEVREAICRYRRAKRENARTGMLTLSRLRCKKILRYINIIVLRKRLSILHDCAFLTLDDNVCFIVVSFMSKRMKETSIQVSLQ